MEPMGEPDKPEQSELPPMRAQDYSEREDWPGYFKAVLGKEPRDTLVRALDLFTDEGFAGGLAVDIAAGEGRDTLELLKRGWKVVATDSHPDAFSYLWPRVPEAWTPQLTTIEVNFAEMEVPPCDLVNASFALPFCEPRHFPELLGQDRSGDSSGWPVRGAVFWETRFLGVDLESDPPLPRGDVEATGGL